MLATIAGSHISMDRAKVRVLVLDDDAFMLKLLSRILVTNGYAHTATCQTGRAALKRVAQSHTGPQIILCDLNMPEMDGVEFVRELVARKYAGSLIFISGENVRVLEAAAKLARAHSIRVLGHLGKPFSAAALIALLEARSSLVPATVCSAGLRQWQELSAAITQHQFVNYYQPKVDVKTCNVVGVETLVRWLHPEAGVIFPDQFISVAEDHGLIDDLTWLVVDGALAQAKQWQVSGAVLDVSINFSMGTLASLDFPDTLARRARDAGVSPAKIIVEVTESRLVGDARATLDVLTRLRIKGFRLSIDDFGTGHSSLTNLRDLPFDELKVDRGFVRHAGTDKTVRAMYDASLGIARSLGIDVVAEGVEDQADWDFLRKTGCDFAQGYFIGRPMPADEMLAWESDWQSRVRSGLAASA